MSWPMSMRCQSTGEPEVAADGLAQPASVQRRRERVGDRVRDRSVEPVPGVDGCDELVPVPEHGREQPVLRAPDVGVLAVKIFPERFVRARRRGIGADRFEGRHQRGLHLSGQRIFDS